MLFTFFDVVLELTIMWVSGESFSPLPLCNVVVPSVLLELGNELPSYYHIAPPVKLEFNHYLSHFFAMLSENIYIILYKEDSDKHSNFCSLFNWIWFR